MQFVSSSLINKALNCNYIYYKIRLNDMRRYKKSFNTNFYLVLFMIGYVKTNGWLYLFAAIFFKG